jgi:hypothetical protein
VEIIGYIISVLALIYLFFKQQAVVRYRQEHPELFKDEELTEEDDSLREFLKAIEKESHPKESVVRAPPPPPPRKAPPPPKKTPLTSSLKEYHLKSQIETRRIKSPIENRRVKTPLVQRYEEMPHATVAHPLDHLAEEVEETEPSRAKIVFLRLSDRRDMVIYHEILDKPKSMRPFP